MKRVTAALAALAVGLAACGGDDGTSDSPQPEATSDSDDAQSEASNESAAPDESDDADGAEEVALTVSTWTAEATGWVDWWPAMIDSFETANPGYTVEVQQIPFADLVTSLTTRFVAGDGPDLVHIPLPLTTLPAWAEAGFLLDLDSYIKTTDIPGEWPDTQQAMEWNGTSYGALMQDYGYVLFYNQGMLDDAGVAVPTTVDELLAAAAAATTGDQFGYAVTADSTVNFLRDVFQLIAGTNAPWIDGDSWNFEDPAVVSAVEAWRTLATEASPQGTDINQKRQSFFNGNSAMMIEGPFILGQIPDNAPAELVDQLHVAQLPFPSPAGDVSNGMSIYSGIDSDKLEAAQAFISHVTSQSTLESLASAVTSPVARRSANAVLAGTPDRDQVIEATDNVAGLLFPASAQGLRADFADFQTIATEWFQKLLTTDISVAEAMAGLQSELEAEDIAP